MWDKTDCDNLEEPIKELHIPPTPPSPSPDQLDTWFTHSRATLTALIRLHTPVSRPFYKSKPWWSPSLPSLRKKYAKASRLAKRHRTEAFVSLARLFRQGYFEANKKSRELPLCGIPSEDDTPQHLDGEEVRRCHE